MIIKRIVIGLIAGIFLSLGGCVYLSYYYMNTRPRQPHPELGRIFIFNIHRTIVYLTKNEYFIVHFLFTTMIVLIIITLFLNVYFKPFNNSG